MNLLPNLKPDHGYKDRRYKQSTHLPAPNTGINELRITTAMEKLASGMEKEAQSICAGKMMFAESTSFLSL